MSKYASDMAHMFCIFVKYFPIKYRTLHQVFDKIVNKWALQVLYVDLLHFLQAYNIVWTSQTLVFGKVQFFFSGLMVGPTYQPPVRHSNPNAPLCLNTSFGLCLFEL